MQNFFSWLKISTPWICFLSNRQQNLQKNLIKKSLVEYKFKDWTKTQTTGKKVTTRMRQERAENIARVLGDPLKWHSHGRGITMQELHSEEIRLIIDDYGENEKLSKNIHQYYDLLKDYCRKMDVQLALHPANGFSQLI